MLILDPNITLIRAKKQNEKLDFRVDWLEERFLLINRVGDYRFDWQITDRLLARQLGMLLFLSFPLFFYAEVDIKPVFERDLLCDPSPSARLYISESDITSSLKFSKIKLAIIREQDSSDSRGLVLFH